VLRGLTRPRGQRGALLPSPMGGFPRNFPRKERPAPRRGARAPQKSHGSVVKKRAFLTLVGALKGRPGGFRVRPRNRGALLPGGVRVTFPRNYCKACPWGYGSWANISRGSGNPPPNKGNVATIVLDIFSQKRCLYVGVAFIRETNEKSWCMLLFGVLPLLGSYFFFW